MRKKAKHHFFFSLSNITIIWWLWFENKFSFLAYFFPWRGIILNGKWSRFLCVTPWSPSFVDLSIFELDQSLILLSSLVVVVIFFIHLIPQRMLGLDFKFKLAFIQLQMIKFFIIKCFFYRQFYSIWPLDRQHKSIGRVILLSSGLRKN